MAAIPKKSKVKFSLALEIIAFVVLALTRSDGCGKFYGVFQLVVLVVIKVIMTLPRSYYSAAFLIRENSILNKALLLLRWETDT